MRRSKHESEGQEVPSAPARTVVTRTDPPHIDGAVLQNDGLGRASWVSFIGMVVVICGLTVASYVYYSHEREAVWTTRQTELKAIAVLKADSIADWRVDRLREVRLNASGLVRVLTLAMTDEAEDQGQRGELLANLKLIQEYGTYQDVILTRPDGTVLLSAVSGTHDVDSEARRLSEQAVTTGDAVFGELFRCPTCGQVHVDVAAPIVDGQNRAVAVLILRSDPNIDLFPLIQLWPTPSPSAETLLVARDGDDALLLNVLRHKVDPALSVRHPLSRVDIPAVQAALGTTGAFEGRDYREVEVQSVLVPVNGSPWTIVSKVDNDEVLAEFHTRRRLFLACFVLAMLLVASLAHMAHRSRNQRLQQALLRVERERWGEAERARQYFDIAGIMMVVLDRNAVVRRINQRGCEILGYDATEIIGRSWFQHFIPERYRSDIGKVFSRLIGGSLVLDENATNLVLTRSGDERLIAFHNALVRDADESVVGVLFSGEDITEQKRDENALQEAKAFLDRVMNTAADPIFVKDENRRFVLVNDALCAIVGRPREALLGDDGDDMFPPEQTAVFRQVDAQVLETGLENLNEEDLSDLATGEVRTIVTRKTRFIDHAGKPFLVGAIRDISDRKRTARAIEASERRYRRLFEAARDGVLILDAVTGEIVDVNPFMTELTGYSQEDFLGKHLWEIGTLKDIASSAEAFAELQANEYIRYDDLPLKTRDGRKIAVEFVSNVYLVDGHKVIQCNIRDISARKRAEESVRESEREFRSLAEAMPQIVWMTRPDGANIFFNQQWMDYTGLTLTESLGDGWLIPFHPEDKPLAWRAWQAATQDNKIYSVECRLRRADGAYHWWLIRGVPMRDASGEILKWFGTCTDIEEIKQTELALRETEQRFRVLFEQAADCILLMGVRPDGMPIIQDANHAVFKVLGYSRDELIGQPITFLDADFDALTLTRERRERIRSESGAIIEVTHRCKDGTKRDFECSVREITIGERVLGISVERDVTERRRLAAERAILETRLRVSQKLESIGTLASGVAHEINNPLNVILNYGQLILDEASVSAQVKDFAQNIVAESDRVAGIVRTLLNFARQERETYSPSPMAEIVERTLSLMRAVLRKDQITVRCEIPAELPEVKCRSQQIQQVVMNLLTNARDATNERYPMASVEKTIKVSASFFEEEGAGWVRLTVEDHGEGIPANVVDRMFDPFFTTKGRDKGTGLGLSISYSIVKEHQGKLWFETTPGAGTRFHVDLHADDGEAEPDQAVQ